jgi:hypothetical protein
MCWWAWRYHFGFTYGLYRRQAGGANKGHERSRRSNRHGLPHGFYRSMTFQGAEEAREFNIMNQPSSTIPYEKQFDRQSTRTCGAACLTMVYRSFGQEIPQRLIWPLIAKKNLNGRIASTTHLMVADATNRRFAAVAIQVRDPLRALRRCRDTGIHVILNHRLKPDSPAGHYTVFVDIDETHVTLHDPYFGPSRRIEHAELLDLWQPRIPNSEIVGNFLIGIASQPPEPPPCEKCHTAFFPNVQCPKCKNPVALQPASLLGCLNSDCAVRLWNYVCCPSCDLTWNFTPNHPQTPATTGSPTPVGGAAQAAPASATAAVPPAPKPPSSPPHPQNPLNLAQIFADLDKFSSHILSIPGAADHPDIKAQLDFIVSSKDKLARAVADEQARQKERFDKLAVIVQATKERQEAHQKKLDELSKPLLPLDGDALARALLKNLGFAG